MKKRSTFTGKLGFVLSAAGASVGLGNIWRFPYLAASYGGGIFLLVYILLAVTFGYTMIMAETTVGRMTRKAPVGAFESFGKGAFFRTGGWINSIIPALIVPYYSVIGGWVMKYLWEYLKGNVQGLAEDTYFSGFTGSAGEQFGWFLAFALVMLVIIFMGVQNGIERVSKILMPILVVLAFIICIYSMTRPGAMAGVAYVLIPDFSRFTWATVVSAMEQMFYSLSIAMGILYTFGSYMKKEDDIEKSSEQVEVFDTVIAVMAALMIIPAVFAFSGGAPEVLQSGPSLMFITMPKIFASMGVGRFMGSLFFLLVLFAALTSAIALTEAVVATFEDQFGWSRKKATLASGIITLGLGSLSAFGFNLLSSVKPLGMDFLSFFDFITNGIMMPIAAILTCVLVVKYVGLRKFADEVLSSSKFRRRKIFEFVIRYLAIAFLLIILVSSVLSTLGIISI